MERPEAEFLVLEIDIPYALDVLLPSLLERHLGGRAKEDYDVEVVAAGDPSRLIHASGPGREPHIAALADASVRIFDVQYDRIFRRLAPRLPPEAAPGAVTSGARPPGAPPSPDSGGRGRWQLSVRHRAGSIEAVVTRARWRNLAVSTAILGLMLATIAALVQFTRRANRLAKLQMEFVTSVSHELRTPLSVIRTAGHNLGAGVVRDDKQVRRYGSLIRDQAERLTGIVEQVLLFANVRAGRAIGAREPCSVQAVVEDAMAVLSAALESSRCTVETSIEAGLPPVMADPLALRHALQNLLANAANYGAEGGWIGVSASAVTGEADARVEIRVSDRGPGIPAGEIPMIFDPFFRGKRAIEDQLHGTGLGLSLVKRIVEAHGGTVSVNSKLGAGAEFVISLPAVPEDQINEFADSPDRG